MAVGIPAPQCVLIRLKGTYGTGVWNIVQHLQYSGTAPQVGDLATVCSQIASAYVANIAPLAHSSVVLTGVDAADLTSPAAAATSATNNNAGTRTGTAMTSQVACVSSWQINVRYRGGHPRTYWPVGVIADTTNSRLWTSTFVTAAQTGFNGYRTSLNAIVTGSTTYKMVAVSFHTNHAARQQGIPFTINSVTVHGRVDSQRHRLGKETP